MFQGFNESTILYYKAICKENCKRVYQENEQLYLEGVKWPLEELYIEWYNYFGRVDGDLLSNRRRCISSAYNDARFCRGTPVKEYFYIRFKLNKIDRKNALGFFFDASLDGYKYGLNLYNPDAGGMNRIRDYILNHKHAARGVIEAFNGTGLLEMQGEKNQRASYPKEDIVLREWLERKRISFIQEENLNAAFYKREMLDKIFSAFDSVNEVYFMLKEAL